MTKTVLLLHAHPNRNSLTHQLAVTARHTLAELGHHVLETDLYAARWKAVFDGDDFLARRDPDHLSFVRESGHAFATGTQTADVIAEQDKLRAADAVVLQFPLWWFGLPAIMKGWFDRVYAYGFAYGFRGAGNTHRYGEGALAGKRAMLSTTVGGPAADYGPRGINGPLEHVLFPITHGMLFFPGMDVLPTYAVYGASKLDEPAVVAAKQGLVRRLEGLFHDAPIAYRRQNGGEYPDRHTLAPEVAPGVTGFAAHVA